MASGTYIRSIIVVNILTLNLGIHLGWTPWLIENLENANSSLNATIDQITWIASIPQIGDLIGGFIVFVVGNHIGRRSMLFCSLIPLLFSWMMLLLYDTVLAIYAIRTVMGISAGMCFPLILIYFSEIALVNHRGMVTSSQAFSTKLGVLLMYIYSAFVPSKNTFIFPTTLVVLSGLLLLTVPESPYYLVLHKNYEEAKKSLTRLRQPFEEKEIQMIVRDTENCAAKCKWKDLFLVSNNRKVLLVVTSIVVTSQFAGNAIILAYINDIFIAFGKKSSMKLLTSCTGTIGCVSTVCTMLLVDRMGRKTIFLISVIGGGISSFIIGTCSFLLEKNYHVDVTVCLIQLNAGLFLEWTSQMITKSSVDNFPFKIAIDEASWIVSLLKLGTAFGCFLSIFIVDFLGRKISILVTIIPTCLSWLLGIWNPSILNLYMASFISGIVSGIILTSGSMFVTEISPAHIRGALCSCFVLMHYCSNLLGCVIGSFSTVQQYSYVAISLAMLQFLIFIWCPETPYYLLRRKKFAAAMDSLIFLRGSGDVTEEMDSIIRAVESSPRCNGILSSILHLISESGGKAAILIGAGVMTVQAFSSSIILIGYAQTIFEKIHDVQLQGVYTSIVLATVYLISYLMCISLVDRLGGRPLMVISTIGVSSCSFLLAVYFCMQENAIDTTNLRLLSFVAVLFYTISFSLGLAGVPFVVVNEIFPVYAKATCISFCFCINFVWSFIALRVWSEIMFKHNAYSFVFWFISGLNTFSIFFLVFYFPETKRKSLLQIRKNFIEGMKK